MNRNNNLDFNKVIPVETMSGEDGEETELLKSHMEEAESYLSRQRWCEEIKESYFGLGIGGVVAIFLFRIVPNDPQIDNYIWVIVGDVPPLYLTTEECPNPACALDGYIGAMEKWADAAIQQRSKDGLPPVEAPFTRENGQALKKRLKFLDREVLSQYKDDLV